MCSIVYMYMYATSYDPYLKYMYVASTSISLPKETLIYVHVHVLARENMRKQAVNSP